MPKPLHVKQQEAEERAAAHAKRSAEQQLALIAKRPGHSAAEVERIQRKAAKKEKK